MGRYRVRQGTSTGYVRSLYVGGEARAAIAAYVQARGVLAGVTWLDIQRWQDAGRLGGSWVRVHGYVPEGTTSTCVDCAFVDGEHSYNCQLNWDGEVSA